MQEGGVYSLADNLLSDRGLLDVRGAHQSHKRILLLLTALGFQSWEQDKRRYAAQKGREAQSSFLTF